MTTLSIEEARERLDEIVSGLPPGAEVVITRDGEPVATLAPLLPKGVPIIGRGKGTLIEWTDDDEHLQDFAEYMP